MFLRRRLVGIPTNLGGPACGHSIRSARILVVRRIALILSALLVLAPVSGCSGGDDERAWPKDYQGLWMGICEAVTTKVADDPAVDVTEVCRCTLDGLMSAFTLADYESWSQEVRDGAAAPYVTMCWPKD